MSASQEPTLFATKHDIVELSIKFDKFLNETQKDKEISYLSFEIEKSLSPKFDRINNDLGDIKQWLSKLNERMSLVELKVKSVVWTLLIGIPTITCSCIWLTWFISEKIKLGIQ